MKKSSFSAREYLDQSPRDDEIKEKDGHFHIPIGPLENALDFFDWGTRNFQWQIFKDGYASLCVAASLELVLSFKDDDGNRTLLSFVGASNFALASMAPIHEFLATAKSLCIKNAASDAGRRLGRGLNADLMPEKAAAGEQVKSKGKMKPDIKIMQQFLKAVEDDDQETIATLTGIYNLVTV